MNSYNAGEISDLSNIAEQMDAEPKKKALRRGPGMFGATRIPPIEPDDIEEDDEEDKPEPLWPVLRCEVCGEKIDGPWWSTKYGPIHAECMGDDY